LGEEMRKELNEKTIPELEKTRKQCYKYAYAFFVIGTILQAGAWVIYFSTFIIGLPVMMFLVAIYLYLISNQSLHQSDTISTMIYLKEKVEE
jgi:hypothetical protein